MSAADEFIFGDGDSQGAMDDRLTEIVGDDVGRRRRQRTTNPNEIKAFRDAQRERAKQRQKPTVGAFVGAASAALEAGVPAASIVGCLKKRGLSSKQIAGILGKCL